jgi:hypothetical protein
MSFENHIVIGYRDDLDLLIIVLLFLTGCLVKFCVTLVYTFFFGIEYCRYSFFPKNLELSSTNCMFHIL